ncbi:hypothetical protein TcCL_NonESM09316 [Trypanosoma cruzi]|nr:hypothetical protein TcCL_NonESM09316 [Trypanosoma cruzi]
MAQTVMTRQQSPIRLLLLRLHLALRLAADLLVAIAALLHRLAGRQLLLAHAETGLAVVGLNALQGGEVVVDEAEAGRLAPTKLRLEAKDGNLILVGDLVERREAAADEFRGDGAAPAGVVHLHDELLAVEQLVHLELRRADRHLRLLLLEDHVFFPVPPHNDKMRVYAKEEEERKM